MTDLIFVFAFLLLSYAMGNKVLSQFKISLGGTTGEIAFASGVGLGIFAYVTLLLGLAGWLHAKALLAVLVVAALWTYHDIEKLVSRLLGGLKRPEFRGGVFGGLIVSLFAATFLATLTGALGPDLGNDSLCYHLEDPKVFVRNHRIEYLPYSENSLFPYFMEMLFAVGLMLKGPLGAKLFHWLTGFLTFLGVISLGRRILDPFYAFLAGAIFLLTPGIHNQMATAYIDVGLAFVTLLAYYALYLWVEKKEGKWLLLCGLFSGFALSVKYQGLFSFLVSSLVIFLETLREKKGIRALAHNFAVYVGVAIAASFIWYLRSYLHTGTPIYPYFSSDFGGVPYQIDLERNGMGKNLLGFILLFWNFTMYPAVFGGTGNQYGIAFLVFLPFLLAVKRTRPVHFLILVSFAHIVVWFCLRHNIRYLFPVVPLLSILVAYVTQELTHRSGLVSAVVKGALVFIFLLNTGMAFYHNRNVYRASLGFEPREDYLRRTERSFGIAEQVNRIVPESEKILNAEEIRAFYFRPRMIREQIYRRKSGYPERSRNGEEVIRFLRADGFRYLLVTVVEGPGVPELSRHPLEIRELVKDPKFVKRHLRELYSSRFVDEEKRETKYFLYETSPSYGK